MQKSAQKLPNNILNFLKYMENIKTASPLTVNSYKKDLQQAFAGFGENLDEAQLLKQAHQSMTQWGNLSPASRNRKGATLKSYFQYLFKEKLIQRPLADLIYSTKVPKKIPNFISLDEALACLRASADAEKILFLLLYGGGLRVSEACALQWKNISLEQGTLRILGKGQKERLIAIPRNIAIELQQWKKNQATDFVFAEQALSPRKAYQMISDLGKKANLLKPLHPHALRHSYATHLLSNGANLRVLQELLGHASLAATEKYTHLNLDQLARTMEQHHPLNKIRQ